MGWLMNGPKVVGFIDIGTNSVRLLVVRINPNRSYTVLSQEKEVVRLGEGEFRDQMLTPEAIYRGVTVIKKFAELSRAYGAEEVIGVATSAAREAKNQIELLNRLRDEARVDVSVISGKEEARLIYLGVASGLYIKDRKALFIDIGGGSTEIIIGDQEQYSYLDSLKLGAIRLTNLFLPEGAVAPVPSEIYNKMCKYVKNAVIRTTHRVKEEKLGITVASSGTAINLAEIANRMAGNADARSLVLRRSQLRKVMALLCSLPIQERRKVPGINPERADIIIGGGAILETLMDEFGVEEAAISERGLRDGMLAEYLDQGGDQEYKELSVRERSVLQLGRSCNLDEMHAERVRGLALSLFDSGFRQGLHNLGDWERELLSYAAFLHDIGDFISFNNHHLHSHYIIRNAELLGFDQREILIMADLAQFHRKKIPRKKDPDLDDLDEHSQKVVILLSALLRIAESLDRSHTGLVNKAEFVSVQKGSAVLDLYSNEDVQLEMWGVESDGKAFEKAFGRSLTSNVIRI
jgi:exopolyphosphatase/guanosine-5'-triphosphate,3'-diphosphate pyrophosphatase